MCEDVMKREERGEIWWIYKFYIARVVRLSFLMI